MLDLDSPCLDSILECLHAEAPVALQAALGHSLGHVRAGKQLAHLPLLPGLLYGVTQLGQPQAALVDVVGQVVVPAQKRERERDQRVARGASGWGDMLVSGLGLGKWSACSKSAAA